MCSIDFVFCDPEGGACPLGRHETPHKKRQLIFPLQQLGELDVTLWVGKRLRTERSGGRGIAIETLN